METSFYVSLKPKYGYSKKSVVSVSAAKMTQAKPAKSSLPANAFPVKVTLTGIPEELFLDETVELTLDLSHLNKPRYRLSGIAE